MTEIKMTRKLRKELFALMNLYDNLSMDDISFSDAHLPGLTDNDLNGILGDIHFGKSSSSNTNTNKKK